MREDETIYWLSILKNCGGGLDNKCRFICYFNLQAGCLHVSYLKKLKPAFFVYTLSVFILKNRCSLIFVISEN